MSPFITNVRSTNAQLATEGNYQNSTRRSSVASDRFCAQFSPELVIRYWMGLLTELPGQGVFGALVQATNTFAVVSLLVDFEIGAYKKSWRDFLDSETDGIGGPCKPSVPNCLAPGFSAPSGK
jgi:hypothetical protein